MTPVQRVALANALATCAGEDPARLTKHQREADLEHVEWMREMLDAAGMEVVSRVSERDQRQRTVADWVVRCWGQQVLDSAPERAGRLLEEALELAQACELPADKAAHILAYVYGRDAGDPAQEAGGVGITLLALCASLGLSADTCEQVEVAKVLAKPVDHFRSRHAEKEAAGVMVTAQEHAG